MNNHLMLIISVILFFTGIAYHLKKRIISNVVISAFFLLYSVVFFVSDHFFTGRGIDNSILYHIQYGLAGSGWRDYWQVVLIGILGIFLSVSLPYYFFTRKNCSFLQKRNERGSLFYMAIFAAFFCSPLTWNLIDQFYLPSHKIFFTEIPEIDFTAFYRRPVISGEKSRVHPNLVVIYAESLEGTYFDEELFPGLLKELRELRSQSVFFSGIEQIEGSGWTVAGMTSTQCGIPLFAPSHKNSMSGMDLFLADAVCIGDLLAREGYRMSFVQGSNLHFAGTGKIYSTHGFQEVLGAEVLHKTIADKKYLTHWGLYDDSLLDLAYEKFIKLSDKQEPFGLFMSTIDTHPPEGNPSASCEGISYRNWGNQEFTNVDELKVSGEDNPMLNAVACSDYLIGNFVKKIIASKYADNTVIVVLSDHLAKQNTASEILEKGKRKGLFMVLGSDNQPLVIDKRGSPIDIAPTILAFLGYEAEMGLGRNLTKDEETLVSLFGNFDTVLKSWRESLVSFWSFPLLSRGGRIKINPHSKTVSVNNRLFRLPVLIEVDPDMIAIMKFDFSAYGDLKVLPDHRAELAENTPFLWVDRCGSMGNEFFRNTDGYCLEYGVVGSKYKTFTSVYQSMSVEVNDILGPSLQ